MGNIFFSEKTVFEKNKLIWHPICVFVWDRRRWWLSITYSTSGSDLLSLVNSVLFWIGRWTLYLFWEGFQSARIQILPQGEPWKSWMISVLPPSIIIVLFPHTPPPALYSIYVFSLDFRNAIKQFVALTVSYQVLCSLMLHCP